MGVFLFYTFTEFHYLSLRRKSKMFEPIRLILFHARLKLILKRKDVIFFSKRTILLENVLIHSFSLALDT